eukprot:scaffold10546_cov59-Phaeocystis_antarctica.AAC.2
MRLRMRVRSTSSSERCASARELRFDAAPGAADASKCAAACCSAARRAACLSKARLAHVRNKTRALAGVCRSGVRALCGIQAGPQQTERAGVVSQHLQGAPGVEARLGKAGPQRQRRAVRGHAVSVPPLVLVRDPEVVVRLGSVGLHRDGGAEAGRGLGGAADVQQVDRHVVVRGRLLHRAEARERRGHGLHA